MTVAAYPLAWPPGWKRTAPGNRTRARFAKAGKRQWVPDGGSQRWDGNKPLTIEQARTRVMDELRRFGVGDWNVVISSNLVLRLDGAPRSGQSAPADPGVAVYWRHGSSKDQRCMAIDRYDRVADNIAAIAATLEAMRAIERHGGAEILSRAFAGFAALAAPEQPFQVLGVSANASEEEIERAFRLLASKHHPDKGGDAQAMARINAARDALMGGV